MFAIAKVKDNKSELKMLISKGISTENLSLSYKATDNITFYVTHSVQTNILSYSIDGQFEFYICFYRILNNNGHIIAFKNNIRISFTEL